MLTIRRSATIVSMTQLESDAAGKGLVATPEKAVREVQSSALPLYSFPAKDGFSAKRVRSFGDLESAAPAVPDVDEHSSRMYASTSDEDAVSLDGGSDSGGAQVVPQRSVLDMLVLAEWEDRAEQGLFRYDVTACPTKMVPGSYGFVAQLNEGRASKKRPTEFRVDQVDQPFDSAKFNFTKALQKEVLFQFEPGAHGRVTASFTPAAPTSASPNLVLINVSPIEYGHILLVPRVLDDLKQLITPQSMLLALQFAREANNPYFRMTFNSLGAYATINHLHFQGYYLAAPFAIERAVSRPVAQVRGRGVEVHELVDYPLRALVFEAGDSLVEIADVVAKACQNLSARNMPHNLFIADCGARVFLYPNAFAERKAKGEVPYDILDTQVDPAGFEGAGHMVWKREQDYAQCTQESAWRLLTYQSYTEDRFNEAVEVMRADNW